MTKSTLIDRTFDDLAHSLRVLLEADYRANRGNLLFVDRAEAIGNIETGLTSVLNAFHSLYDALSRHPAGKTISWYENGALATVLAIRNARHHNRANKVRTLYTYHVQEARRPTGMEMYVLVGFPSPDPTATTFDLFLSWSDLRLLLTMPERDSRISSKTRVVIETYLGTAKFGDYAHFYDQPEASVFFNVIPLFVNAGMTIVPAMSGFLETLSTEGETFATVFGTPAFAMTNRPDVDYGPFVLPS